MEGLLLVFGGMGLGLAALWVGKQIDLVRGDGSERVGNAVGVVVMALYLAVVVWAKLQTGPQGPNYRGVEFWDQ